jgi:4,5-dihydroxyphthalate decarboxylase
MQWMETTKSSYGGSQKTAPVKYFFPDGFTLLKAPKGVAEHELLLNGKCDALITSFSPSTLAANPKIKTLFPDVRAAEMEYYRKTKLFPIMHAIAIRADVVKEHPWLPKAVFEMYSAAKQRAYDNLGETGILKVTLPWLTQEFDKTRELMGENFWQYGIEANRKELESIMRYVHDQGLVKQKVSFEDLFDPTTIKIKE